MNERQRLEAAIATLEAQRGIVGDAVTDAALAPMRQRLAGIAEREQSLRQVTILFMDVVGSTALSRQLDPEEVHAIIDGALRRLSAIVYSHQGAVLQYAGDSILSVFGATEAREDDSERAVHCGLAIAQVAQQIGGDVRAVCPSGDFNVRVGVHTGSVLLGGGVDEASTIRGIAVNIAARMEQTAPAGRVRISHDTQRLVRGKFDLTEEAPIVIKGFAEPMRSHLVLRAKPRRFAPVGRGIEGVATTMVGRDAELAKLMELYETAGEYCCLHLVTVSGDPGLGKTRLMSEFEHWLQRHHTTAVLLRGKAQPYSNSVPYGLVRDLLAWHFEILESDTLVAAQIKLAQGLAAYFGDQSAEQVALVGRLIGLDYSSNPDIANIEAEGRQLRDRAFHLLAQYLRLLYEQAKTPIVILLDDLHWADDGSLDFVNHVARACHDVPILVICLTRPALFERRPMWCSGRDNHLRIELEPLSRRSSRELVEALLSRLDTVPNALRDLVTSGADGNPYFVEEIVGMLIDDGVLVTIGERWRVEPDRLLQFRVPSTLAGVLQARLDALPNQELVTLQRASVIGHVFWDEALQRMSPVEPHVLESLTRRDLARGRDTTAFEGAHEYVFKHHLLHKVTYDGVLKRDKREQHRLTAEWLVARSGERASEYLDLIADHFEKAGDTVKAVQYLRKAASKAASSFAIDVALSYFDRALLLVSEARERFDLLLWRLVVAFERRVSDSIWESIGDMERLAEELNDDGCRALAASFRATYAAHLGDLASTAAAATKSIALAQVSGKTAAAIRAHNQWGRKLMDSGDFDLAQVHLAEGLALSRSTNNWSGEAMALIFLARVAQARGRHGEARENVQGALSLARTNSDEPFANEIRILLAEIDLSIGQFDRAEAQLQSVWKVYHAMGWPEGEANVLVHLAMSANLCGNATQAVAWLDQANTVDPENEEIDFQLVVDTLRGDVFTALVRTAEAEVAYARCLDACRSLQRPLGVVEIQAKMARLALTSGDLGRATKGIEGFIGGLNTSQDFNTLGESALDILLVCYQVLAAAADERAKGILNSAHESLHARASLLDPIERENYLTKVLTNRAIIAAWREQQISNRA